MQIALCYFSNQRMLQRIGPERGRHIAPFRQMLSFVSSNFRRQAWPAERR